MKRLFAQCGVLALVLTVALSAGAKSKSENITLYHDASVNGTTLLAGDYVVKYDVESSKAQVTFLRSGQTEISAEGEIKTLPNKAARNQVFLDSDNRAITEINFGGKDTAIIFRSSAARAGE